MKVIASCEGEYVLCKMHREELQKYFNTYYSRERAKNLKVGDEVDLGKGYDFASEAKTTLLKTQDFVNAHKKIINAITMGVAVMYSDNNQKEMDNEKTK